MVDANFFAELERDNSRTFWRANQHRYDERVRAPFLALLDAIGTPGSPWRVYRPHRDTRFSTDTSPYKTFIGAVCQLDGGTGWFVRVDRRGLFVAAGMPMLARDQLVRFRDAIASEAAGVAFVDAVDRTRSAGREVTTGRYAPLVGAPRGFARDHPRIEWLRAKGVELPLHVGTPQWLATGGAGRRVRGLLEGGGDVTGWLERHVGPSTLSPEEIWGR